MTDGALVAGGHWDEVHRDEDSRYDGELEAIWEAWTYHRRVVTQRFLELDDPEGDRGPNGQVMV